MANKINGRTPEEIKYNCMMYRLKRPNEWDEHCAGSLTLKGRVETAKWAYNYIQQLEDHFRDLTKKVEQLERERDAAVEIQPKWISVENPPKEDGEYMVAAVTHEDEIVKIWDIFASNNGWCGDLGDFKKVLYYMPFESLPEPPKEG